MSKAAGFTHDSANNRSVDWYTPSWLFEELGLTFCLDPCHPATRIPWIPVTLTYCEADNGLTSPWYGRVWLNPPYGKYTYRWLEKMHQHRDGVALVFARTDCKWFHDFVAKADAVLFLSGRVKFVDGLGVTGGSGAGSGSMLVAWGPENVEALQKMSRHGYLITNTN
jgi:hypothetical protein